MDRHPVRGIGHHQARGRRPAAGWVELDHIGGGWQVGEGVGAIGRRGRRAGRCLRPEGHGRHAHPSDGGSGAGCPDRAGDRAGGRRAPHGIVPRGRLTSDDRRRPDRHRVAGDCGIALDDERVGPRRHHDRVGPVVLRPSSRGGSGRAGGGGHTAEGLPGSRMVSDGACDEARRGERGISGRRRRRCHDEVEERRRPQGGGLTGRIDARGVGACRQEGELIPAGRVGRRV